jgi:hypothetical protein
MRTKKDDIKQQLCSKCLSLYEQSSSYLSDYCLHCKELVLKLFLSNKKKER